MTSQLAAAPKAAPRTSKRQRTAARRHSAIGWLFVAPFGIVFLVFLIAPLAYAFYLSLFKKALIGGTQFVAFDNYAKAFTDQNFLDGVWFVVRFSVVLIPLQMIISLVIALVLDAVATKFTGSPVAGSRSRCYSGLSWCRSRPWSSRPSS